MNTLFDQIFDQETDLLAQVDAIEIDNTERIAQEDKEHCILIQQCCHLALDQLEMSYKKMMEDSKEYIECGIVKIDFNETFRHILHDWQVKDPATKYTLKHYVPCMQEKTVRILFAETCHMFANDIVSYFNSKYGINVKCTDRFKTVQTIDKFDPTFRPYYEEIVDEVIAHLGGRTFAQTMEDEVYANALKDYNRKYMEIKGRRITVNYFIDTSYFSTELTYSTLCELDSIIDAIYYFFTGYNYKGSTNTFLKTTDNIKAGETYECIIPEIEHFRFFKNRKMEIQFKTESLAKRFYDRIKN